MSVSSIQKGYSRKGQGLESTVYSPELYYSVTYFSQLSSFNVSFHQFSGKRGRVVVLQGNFAMSLGPFRPFFDQRVIQIDNLISVAISINRFTRF